MASLESKIQQTEKLLKDISSHVNRLDPSSGSLEDDTLLKKVGADTKQEIQGLKEDFIRATEITSLPEQENEIDAIRQKALNLMSRLEKVIVSEYDDAEKAFREKNAELANLMNSVEGLLRNDLGTLFDRLNPARNGGEISQDDWDSMFASNHTSFESLKEEYVLALELKDIDKQIIRLTSIQTRAKSIYQRIVTLSTGPVYEAAAVKETEKKFVEDIQKNILIEPSSYDQDILAALPGNEKERKWNYRLLQAYSDAFETKDVPKGQVSAPLRSTVDVSLMSSLGLVGVRTLNGDDAVNKQDAFKEKGSTNIGIGRNSQRGDIAQAVAAGAESTEHIKDVAQYAHNPNTLVPVYFSLVAEHYATLLSQSGKGTEELSSDLKSRYQKTKDAGSIEKDGKIKPFTFTWTGLDSDGLDMNTGYDTYTFADNDDKKLFLESSMKLLPLLDTLDKRFTEYERTSTLGKLYEGIKSTVGWGLDIMESPVQLLDHLSPLFKDILGPLIGVYTSLNSPMALILGSIASWWSRDKLWTNIPLSFFMLKTVLSALRGLTSGIMKLGKYSQGWPVVLDTIIARVDQSASLDFGEVRPHVGPIDRIRNSYTRESNRRVKNNNSSIEIGDLPIKKILAKKESKSHYDVVRDLIRQRVIGPVSLTYDVAGTTRTVTLPQIDQHFADALLANNDFLIEAEYYKQLGTITDAAARSDFLTANNDNFIPAESVYDAMIDNAFRREGFLSQVITGNALDTSRLEREGVGRMFRVGRRNDADSPGTSWNFPKSIANAVIGRPIRSITNRVPIFMSINPSYFYQSISVRTLLTGHAGRGDANAFLNHLAEHRKENGILDTMNADDIHHELHDLLHNSKVFNHTEERELLEHFAHEIPGVIEKSTWEYAVVQMGFVCRGDGEPVHAETHDFHHLADIVAHIAAHPLATEDDRNAVHDFYERIKKNDKDKPFTPEEIMEMGRLTGARILLPGATDANNHIVDDGRTAMDTLEDDYYVNNIAELQTPATAASGNLDGFTIAYRKWFQENAKSCSVDYDPEKHEKKLRAQKALQEYMKNDGELHEAIEEGKKHDVKKAIDKKMGELGLNASNPEFTAKFDTYYQARLRALTALESGKQSREKGPLETDILTIRQNMREGNYRTSDEYKNALSVKLRSVKPAVVALNFINDDLSLAGTARHADIEAAITAYALDAVARYETTINPILSQMSNAGTSWQSRLSAITAYRKYGESNLDLGTIANPRGINAVTAGYNSIHAELKVGTPAQQYALYKLYKGYPNPEDKVPADKKNTAESVFRDEREAWILTQKDEIKNEIEEVLNDPTLNGVGNFDALVTAYRAKVSEVRTHSGAELAKEALRDGEKLFKQKEKAHVSAEVRKLDNPTEYPTFEAYIDPTTGVEVRLAAIEIKFPSYTTEISEGRAKINRIKAGHRTLLDLCDSIESEVIDPVEADKRFSDFKDANKNDYAAMFLTGARNRFNEALGKRAANIAKRAADAAEATRKAQEAAETKRAADEARRQSGPQSSPQSQPSTSPLSSRANIDSPGLPRSLESRQRDAENLSERLANILSPNPANTPEEQRELLQDFLGELSPQQEVIARRVYGSLELRAKAGEIISFHDVMTAITHVLIYSEVGDIHADIDQQHAAVRAFPNIDQINQNLTRARLAKIDVNVNVNIPKK